jgi:NAD(P)-dependent dehydrogenase (short-subunit alcohol dehydrogenase family)
MDMGLDQHVILVTGSSSGIGRATAVAFGREGAKVAVTYKNHYAEAEKTAHLVKEAGGEAMIVAYDLNDDKSIKAAVDTVTNQWGTVHVLVNNAVQWASRGAPQGGTLFENILPEQWKTMIRSTLEGAYATIQSVAPHMRKQHWGRIVNVSTTLVEDGLPGSAPYTAAKGGLHGMTRSLAHELAESSIYTNVVMPGMTLTERAERIIPEPVRQQVAEQTPTRRLSTPEDIASLIVYLSSRANGHVNGEIIRVSGGS